MANNPPPPNRSANQSPAGGGDGNIADMRDAFARKEPVAPEELAAVRAFIDNKIQMIESDPHLTVQQKAEAIAELKAKRP